MHPILRNCSLIGRCKPALIALVIAALVGCGSASGPAGFWESYQSELIVDRESDQGGYGGHRWIHWESDEAGAFVEAAVRSFAAEEGWEVVERIELTEETVLSWAGRDGLLYFPLIEEKHYPCHLAGRALALRRAGCARTLERTR